MTTNRRKLEICAADIDSVVAAASGGADRVELCSALGEGGLTPSVSLIRCALGVPGISVHVLIRPRGGDFLYSRREVQAMLYDIDMVKELGAHGIVIGALTSSGDIDFDICRELSRHAGNMNITFHRAFDVCRNPMEAAEQIAALGCNRILTSGCAESAEAGIDTLRALNQRVGNQITILAGGGVTPLNAKFILDSSEILELHASARELVQSQMTYRNNRVNMGDKGKDEYSRYVTSAHTVAQLSHIVHT